jgi:Tol biopolymer transport system component
MKSNQYRGNGRRWFGAAALVLIVLALAASLRPAAPAAAAFPGVNGKIAFTSYRTGGGDIYVMNADGSSQTRLMTDSGLDQGAAWSPDGRTIAFSRNLAVYLMNADGTNLRQLLTSAEWPAWSPDGTKIAFMRCQYCDDIWVVNVDGTGLRQLTNHVEREMWPAWSPDGTRIAYHRKVNDNNDEIYVMNADGTGQTRLTNNAAGDYFPKWSPDGAKIVFTSGRDGNGEIYVMNADGSGQTRLTNNTYYEQYPNWSPDGSKIVWQSYKDDSGGEIYVMNADGSNPVRLTNAAGTDFAPDWQPLHPPLAAGDAYSVGEDSTLVISAPGVLGNDSDPDGYPLTAVLVDDVGHGTLALNPNGSFTYTPDPDFTGTDDFTYRANNGLADSTVAAVSITVKPNIPPPFYLTEFGEPGSGDGQFNVPFGVVVDSLGRILVADNNNNRIQVFDSNLNYLISWYGFNNPRALEIDSAGSVYVIDFFGHRLQKRAADGTPLGEWGLTEACHFGGWWPGPTDLALDSLGNIYIVKSEGNCVLKYDASMVFQTWWSATDPIAVAVDSHDNVFVGEAASRSIAKFDSNGELIARFGTYGTGNGEFNYPNSVWLDGEDRLYVADHVNHRVQVFDSENSYLTQWGEWGSGPGQFGFPDAVYVDSLGQIFVSDQSNGRVQVFAFLETPYARADSYVGGENQPLTVASPGVLVNDFDPQGDPLMAVKGTDPAHGTLELQADGSFTYTPHDRYVGPDSFTYKASDGADESNLVTVNLTVEPRLADLTVVKQTVPAGVTQAFDFTLNGASPASVHDAESHVYDALVPGSYDLVEAVPVGWRLDDVACTGGAPLVGPDGVRVTLAVADDVTCTFTNEQLGSIHVVKQVLGYPPAADWAFGGELGNFTLPAAGGEALFSSLPAGSYQVTETPDAGFVTSVVCSGGASGAESVVVDLAPGEVETCTFTNEDVHQIRLVDSAGNGLPGATAKYYSGGWHDIPGATNAAGKLYYDIPDGDYLFRLTYEGGTMEKRQTISLTNPAVVFQTVAVSMRMQDSAGNGLAGAAASFYAGGWKVFGTTDSSGVATKELLPLTYTFKMSYLGASMQKPQDVAADPNVVFATVPVTVRMQNSSGAGLPGGLASYYAGGWHEIGTTGADGNAPVIELLPLSYTFKMAYLGGTQQKTQDVIADPLVVFQTAEEPVTVRLQDSAGNPLAGGLASYYAGGWHEIGTTGPDGEVSVELLPLSYTFKIAYRGGAVQKVQNTAADPNVVFATVPVTVRMQNSSGEGLSGGLASYYAGGWHEIGTTGADGNAPVIELLPLSYTFKMAYLGGTQQKTQDPSADPLVVFQTAENPVVVSLKDSTGVGLPGGVVSYYAGGWKTFGSGVTDANGEASMVLLPGTYTFKIGYGGATMQKSQNIVTNQLVQFTTTQVTVELRDHAGNLLGEPATATYYAGGWKPFGDLTAGSAGKELLPLSYTFKLAHKGAAVQKSQDVGANPLVTFQTGQVTCAACAKYYAGGWQPFTDGMQLLPGTYTFKFSDGRPDTPYVILAGTVNTIP